MKDFVHDHKNLDIVRSHRELASPQALQFAFHLVYDTDKVKNADVIVAPLYGAIDIAQALTYTLKNGSDVYRRITGEEAPAIGDPPPVVLVQQKISRRGLPRSQVAGNVKTLASDVDVIDRTNPADVDRIAKAGTILCVDDSVGTFGSSEKMISWLDSVGIAHSIDWVAAHGGVRWGNDPGLLDRIVAAEPIAVTPTTKRFKKPYYHNFSAYMPDHLIARESLISDRTVLNIPEVVPVVEKLRDMGVVDGVGFDLYETLLKRTVDLKVRRNELHRLASEAFARHGYQIDPDEYGKISRPIWKGEIAEKDKEYKEIDMYQTVRRMAMATLDAKSYPYDEDVLATLVREIIDSELEYEISVTIADDGVADALRQLKEKGIPIGIYSNTPYPREAMLRMIDKAGIREFFSDDNVIFSSETGVVKPSPQTMSILSDRLQMPTSQMAFVGNSYTADVGAASRARAIPIWRLFPDERPDLERQITEWRAFKNRGTA